MNRNILIGVVVAVVLVVGFLLLSNSQKTSSPEPAVTTPTTQDTASPSATVNDVVVTLLEQNSSKESGTATLREVDGKVIVSLNMVGAPEGVAQPAHIHVGSCPDVGAVKYPLTNVMNGMSETTIDVTLDQLRSQLPLGINVHKSQPEASVYISCGDLKL